MQQKDFKKICLVIKDIMTHYTLDDSWIMHISSTRLEQKLWFLMGQ